MKGVLVNGTKNRISRSPNINGAGIHMPKGRHENARMVPVKYFFSTLKIL